MLPVGSTPPGRAVRAPSVSEGWTRRVQGCRLCRPRGPRSGPRVSPPYALARFSSIFYISCRKHRFAGATAIFRRAATPHSPWATNGPRGPHTPGTVAALRVAWPIATVAHRTRGPWFTTALLAPPAAALVTKKSHISPPVAAGCGSSGPYVINFGALLFKYEHFVNLSVHFHPSVKQITIEHQRILLLLH